MFIMKRLFTSAAMFLCSLLTTFAQFSGSGNGTEEDPYLIFSENQLAQVSNYLNQEGVVFKLMKDLDLTDWIAENNPKQGWLPIGVESSPFKGLFYGNNHKITGLMINRSSTNYVGFFGYVSGATIDNLTIEGSIVVGNDNVGAFFGYVSGTTVNNCHVKMTGNNGVKGNSCIGGFSGYSTYTEYNIFSLSATVSSTEKTGGFIGCVDNGTFIDGTVSGNVVGVGDYTGGLLGWATACTMTNISVNSTISGQDYTGGMMGYCATGNLAGCTYEGDLTGNKYVGGVSGSLEAATTSFIDCFTKGKTIGLGDYVGGIVGISKGACIESMENCSHFGDIKGRSYVGGLIGALLNMIETPTLHTYYKNGEQWINEKIVDDNLKIKAISNCTAIGNLSGESFIGGLVGNETTANGYTVRKETAEILGRDAIRNEENVLVKHSSEIWKYDKYNFTYYTYIRQPTSLKILNNYFSGSIQGTDNVGGLVGYKSGGTIYNNYSYATIYGSSNVGGIIGQVCGETVSYSYNTTTIKSNASINSIISATSSNVGRIYGSAETNYTVIGALASAEGNRALSQTRVILQGVAQEVDDDLQNGTSIGPSALKLKANYVSWGWNFDENWNILETESYPYKKYQAAPPVIESNLVSQNMGVSGKSLNGGTVYLYYKDNDAVSTICKGNQWTIATEALQSGAQVKVYADVDGMTPSYFATTFVSYPGSGTEKDPYRIYTAEDLQGASNRGYYKLMNDIDLTKWINENSPTVGWPAIGRNSGEVTYIDGDNHKVTGLWIDTEESFNGLFSNFSAGQIKNLTVEVASGKKVKGGDYTGILIGRNANGSIVNCTVKGDVEGGVHVGGVAGYVESSTLQNLSYTGSVSSEADNAFIGGLIGQTLDCELTACEVNSKITATGKGIEDNGEKQFMKIGGLIGESKGGMIKKSITQNNMTATGENCYAGGLVGYSETPVTLSISEGVVRASGNNTYSGGLVGYALAHIDNSFSTAQTTGTQFSAGLVGYTFNAIDKCYAKGDVFGSLYGGGVVGELDGPSAKLTNSVAYCNVLSLSAQSSWGGRVIGGYKNGASDPDESNYALSTMQVSLNGVPQKKTDNILEGKAMTQASLMKQRTYEQLGWDFTEIWSITEGESYPQLQSNGLNSDDSTEEPEPDEPTPTNDDVITVEDMTMSSGDNGELVICLENKTTDFAAYQMDIALPAGISIVKDKNGNYLVTSTERYDEDGQLGINLIEGNTYRVVLYNVANNVISGNSGALLKIPVTIAEKLVDGEYEVAYSNIIFTEVGGNQLKLSDTTSKIIIKNLKKGDANGDGEINVGDIVEIVKDILHKTTSRFVREAADVNEDGEVNVTDIVLVANIIMGGNPNATRARGVSENTYNDVLSLIQNDNHSMSLLLRNEGGYVASQFELRLSDGQKLESISMNGERRNGHMLDYYLIGDNTYQVVVYSINNQSYSGNDGELLNIKTSGSGDVEIDNILFVTESFGEKRFSPLHGGDVTGIDVAKAVEPFDIYSVDGRVVRRQAENTNGLQKGVYIIKGKKQVVR